MHGGNQSKNQKKSVKPPDGGWGWVIVFASFMIHVIADGVAYTFGLFFVEVSSHLGASKSATSWIASIMAGVTYGSGPIAGAFVNKYGCRPVSIAGSILAAIGFGMSYFAESVTYLYISIGLIGGLGLGLIYLPAIVSVTCYFEERRAFATGIAVCGSGFGTFLLAPLVSILIQEYGWRTALLITAAIIFNCTLFSALFLPLPEEPDEDEEADAEGNIPTILEPSAAGQVESTQPLLIMSNESLHHNLDNFTEENESETAESQEPILKTNSYSLRTPKTNFLSTQGGDATLTLTMSCSHPVLPSCAIGSIDSIHRSARHTKRHSLKFGYGSDVLYENAGTGRSPRRRHGTVGSTHNMGSTSAGIITSRKDIFYSGSVANIPAAVSSNPVTRKLSGKMDRTPDDSSENLEQKKICCCKCSPELYEALRTMMDFSILRNPIFLFFAISNFFTSIGYNVPYVYLVDMAIGDEHNPINSKTSAGYLLSIIGISNTLSRVILGYLSDKPWVNRLYLYNTALTICGIATGLCSHTTNIHWLWVYAVTFGITAGVYVSLTSVILVDLIGLDKLTNAFGLLLLFQGTATVVGPPIVGMLFDEFKDYRYGFWLAGGIIALSGLMLFLIPFFQKKEETTLSEKIKKLPILTQSEGIRSNGTSTKISSNNNISQT